MKSVGLVACLAVTLGLASPLAGQTPAGPAFEVVSIKPSNPAAPGPNLPPVGGRLTLSSAPLRRLIQIAYELSDFQIVGGPDWQTSRLFDIQAKTADPVVGLHAMIPMLKALLADRFQLKVHTETREMPIYALVVARQDGQPGPTVVPSTTDCSTSERDLAEASARDPGALATLQAGPGVPCAIMPVPAQAAGGMTMRANAASMAVLARMLTASTGRKVEDRTGLSGVYDWEMTFDRAVRPRITPQPGGDASAAAPVSDGPSLTTALQEQLGLKLEPARGPVDVLVIDSAAVPVAN
jgi:uncharacterized protein (TIGR03435 family)